MCLPRHPAVAYLFLVRRKGDPVDHAQRIVDFCAKSLIGFGIVSAIPGLLSGYAAAVTAWIFGRHMLTAADVWTPSVATAWVLFVCFGMFLFFQWVQFVRARRLLIQSPRLWLVRILYIGTILVLLLGFAGYIVWLSFQPLVTDIHGDPYDPLGFVVFPLGFSLFPAAGLVLASFLWHYAKRLTKRCSEPRDSVQSTS